MGVVLVFCTGGAPSASESGNLTRVRSATDCVVVPDVVSRFGVVAVSGSSAGLTYNVGIGPIRIGSRSLRTFNGLPRVTGVGFHGYQIAFKRVVPQRRLSTLRFSVRPRTMPFGVPIKCSSVLLSRTSQMPSNWALVYMCQSSRMLLLLSLVFGGISCIAMLRVVVTK